MKPTDHLEWLCGCGWVGTEPIVGKTVHNYFLCPDCFGPVKITKESEQALMKECRRLQVLKKRLGQLTEKHPRFRCRHSARKG